MRAISLTILLVLVYIFAPFVFEVLQSLLLIGLIMFLVAPLYIHLKLIPTPKSTPTKALPPVVWSEVRK